LVRGVTVMKKLMIVVFITLLFSSCALIGKRKVQSVAVFQIPEFTSSLVNVTYSQRSITTADVIAVVPISGEISNGSDGGPNMVEDVKLMLQIAREDFRVKAVILKVESPGGGVNASDLIWNEVMKLKRSGKPIVAFYNGIVASGGYYVSVPADKIIATPETWTGSIGVIMQVPDYSGKMKKEGIKVTTIKSGHRKDMFSPYKPAEKIDIEIMQRIIDSSYERFVQKVAQGRNMNESIVRILADGRIYDAQQALKNGLIDQIGYIEDSFEIAKALVHISDISVIHLKSKTTAINILSLLGGKLLIDNQQCFLLRSPGLYYLWIVDDLNLNKKK